MPTPDVTSFLQLTLAYSALRNINHAVGKMHVLQREAIREGQVGVESALVGGLSQ
jgi:hypothetical protein